MYSFLCHSDPLSFFIPFCLSSSLLYHSSISLHFLFSFPLWRYGSVLYVGPVLGLCKYNSKHLCVIMRYHYPGLPPGSNASKPLKTMKHKHYPNVKHLSPNHHPSSKQKVNKTKNAAQKTVPQFSKQQDNVQTKSLRGSLYSRIPQ